MVSRRIEMVDEVVDAGWRYRDPSWTDRVNIGDT